MACHVGVGLWLLFRLPEQLFSALPRDRADDISAAVARWGSRISPLLIAVYLLATRAAWRRITKRSSPPGEVPDGSERRSTLGTVGATGFWVLVALFIASSLASLFWDPAGRAKDYARHLASELGVPDVRDLQRIERPQPPEGVRTEVGDFSVVFPDSWPPLEVMEISDGTAREGGGITVVYGSPWLRNYAADPPKRGEDHYLTTVCYQVHSTADFLEVLSTVDTADIESADSVLANVANIEVLTTLSIFWFDAAWSFPAGENGRMFVLHFRGWNDSPAHYGLILTDRENGDMGGLLVVYEDEVVTEDQVLSLAGSVRPKKLATVQE